MDINKIEELLKECLEIEGNEFMFRGNFLTDLNDVKKQIEQLILHGVVSSCVNEETLINDLDDKRIVGVTLNENMWHFSRKETAQYLLEKYEIKPK